MLDADRLRPYRDDPELFDNRYVAHLPEAPALLALGVRHLLYVRPGPDGLESDDLNLPLADLAAAGVTQSEVLLSDFTALPPAEVQGAERGLAGGEAPEPGGADEPGWWWYDPTITWFWGGGPLTHACFWHYRGWYHPRLPPALRTVNIPAPPPRLAGSLGFRAVPRTTLFGGPLVAGPHAPLSPHAAHVGESRIHASRTTGRFLGLSGHNAGRSGSLGRFFSGGGFFGG